MDNYTRVSLMELEDSMAGRAEGIEGRFGRGPMGAQDVGVSHWRYAPGFRSTMGHRHREQEEAYLVISGSGEMMLDGDVIGCVYIYPVPDGDYDACALSWVRESRAHLDAPLWRAVSEWLASDWPFDSVEYAPRA